MNAAALLDWYERVRRPLPWRETRDPYALLVSEVMLQQTQAARVVPYYEAFLAAFPDRGRARRRAARPTCSRAWSGLGYNRRALALQARGPARRRARLAGGPDASCPASAPYTAAAVGSFALGRARSRPSTPTSGA